MQLVNKLVSLAPRNAFQGAGLSLAFLLVSQVILAGEPATFSEAAKNLDLAKFPIPEGAILSNVRRMAQLTYEAPLKTAELYDFQKRKLLTQGWKETPGGNSSDDFASGTFAKGGYKISVSANPGSSGKSMVMFIQHGNVDLAKLPVPASTKLLFDMPVTCMFVTELAVDKAARECRELLIKEGWAPYGTVGSLQWFRKNAVRLTAVCDTAPAQENKTFISYSSELLSVDLPIMSSAEGVQYSESPSQVFFDSKESKDEVVEFFQNALGKNGWKSTTEKPFKTGFTEAMIFRNQEMDLLDLGLSTFEGKTRILLRFQTKAEVEAEEKRMKAKISADKASKETAEMKRAKSKINFKLPMGASNLKQKGVRAEFKLPSGKAITALKTWRSQLVETGWSEEVTAEGAMAGTIDFKKEDIQFNLTYVDPGFIPAEVTLTATGADFAIEP